jgi:hypothetical protein
MAVAAPALAAVADRINRLGQRGAGEIRLQPEIEHHHRGSGADFPPISRLQRRQRVLPHEEHREPRLLRARQKPEGRSGNTVVACGRAVAQKRAFAVLAADDKAAAEDLREDQHRDGGTQQRLGIRHAAQPIERRGDTGIDLALRRSHRRPRRNGNDPGRCKQPGDMATRGVHGCSLPSIPPTRTQPTPRAPER